MESNVTPLELERRAAENAGRLIDLIDTNFHRNGLCFPAEPLIEEASRRLRQRRYQPQSKGLPAARRSIAEFYSVCGVPVDPENVIITASASECYSLLFQALADSGDGVALPLPGYPLFEHVATYMRLVPSFYQTLIMERFRIDAGALAQAFKPQTRFLVLISPNNPTGQVATEAEIDIVLAFCAQYNLALICDEVFSDLLYDIESLPRPMARAAEAGVVVFTINGVSKLFASPDLKLSWISVTGPPRKVRRAIGRLELANDMYLSCSWLSQQLLPILFGCGDSFRSELRRDLTERRRILLDAIADMPRLQLQRPTAGVHAVARLLPPQDDEQFALHLLRRTGVHLHPGYLYGLPEDGFVVLSFLKRPQALQEGLARLGAFLRRAP
ncbi:MAG: pyridoxal phosphate-dependent aminotransferase [Spirochaetaceae bacterium]|nr:MAG: pyridoxal phosphate-dependent aminotransferase [Spirochaetaceae bacterium]